MVRDRSFDVAVTGIAARFPGVSSIEAWWSAIKAGRVLTTRYDKQYLLGIGVPANLVENPRYVPVRGHLAECERFDNKLFRMSARDAEMMDPQHRLMLETAWAALEDAGTGFGENKPITAVYASGSGSGYLRAMLAGGPLDPITLDQALHGTEPDFIASFIAYKLDLHGPAISVQTACSSSLVAVHLAVQALLNGDCEQALIVSAGIAFPQAGHFHLPGGIKSASGRCRPFAASADGVVEGSGVACIVLRRLANALAVGPAPYGIILGTASNNDGAAKAGYYAPSAAGQSAVIQAALEAAGVDASSIGYLETHGTGTPIGDPIEWSAAGAALRAAGAQAGQVAIGALKANIGHLDAAAGVAALIKALHVVRDGVVPPLAEFDQLNPLLEAEGASPLFVPVELQPWTGPQPRRAGVSAFGIGGTNAHVIIEQPPRPRSERHSENPRPRLVALSAESAQALSCAASRLRDHLLEEMPNPADVAFTLATGRAALPERTAVAGSTALAIGEALRSNTGVDRGRVPEGGPRPLVFLFPGQGSQCAGMAAPFVEALPGFLEALETCLAEFEFRQAAKLRSALLDHSFPDDELEETVLAQPAIFALEYALASALMMLGFVPAAVVGHSLGEITAATVAGILTLPDAARFVTARGRTMQTCAKGAMLALGCSEAQAQALISRSGLTLEIAAINGAESCAVAGTVEAVRAFEARLASDILSSRLRTRRAFHSSLIEPALCELERELMRIHSRPSTLAFASTATGRLVPAGEQIGIDLFLQQTRRRVRFADALAAIAGRFSDAVGLEVGPGHALASMARAAGLRALSTFGRTGEHVIRIMGALWVEGQPVNLSELCAGGSHIHLPTYPFAGPKWIAPEARRRLKPRSFSSATETAGDAPFLRAEPVQVPAPSHSRPADGVSAIMIGLWRELLGHNDLDESSDFFALGGDSLLITSMVHRVNRALGLEVAPRAIVAARTLGDQTRIVSDLLARSQHIRRSENP